MYHQKKICAFFALFFSFATVLAQEIPPIQNFLPDDYHGESQNWSICQSNTKRIYFANNKGLLEYDGSRWKMYASPNNTIIRSVNAQNDKIYTGCYREFGYWQENEFGNLAYTSLSEKINNKLLEDEEFWKIVFFDKWVLFQSLHRIYIYNISQESFKIISSETNLQKMFKVDNHIYFQKMEQGIFRLENGNVVEVSNNSIFRNNVIINIFSLDKKLLIQTQEQGFFVLDNQVVAKWSAKASSIIDNLSIYSSLQLRDGSFVLGSINSGTYHLSPDGNILARINKKNGLQNNTVLSLFEDLESNVWLGLDNGISVLNFCSPFKVYYDGHGTLGTVYAAARHHGQLYLGTNQGLFCKPLTAKSNFKMIDGTNGQVWSLKVIENTLFCGHNKGTYIIKNNKADLISKTKGTWDIKKIYGKDNLLLLGSYMGLQVVEKRGKTWMLRNKIEEFDISSRYFELVGSSQIFVNHEYKGVFKLSVSKDFRKVEKVEKILNLQESLKSGIAQYDGKLYYLNKSGFYFFDDQKNLFEKDTVLTNLIFVENTFSTGKMIQCDDGRLWIFTNENILAVSPGKIDEKPHIQKIPLPQLLRENMVGYESLLHLNNEEYLLGNTHGYITFDLNKIKFDAKTVAITSVSKSKSNQVKKTIPLSADGYKLNPKENNLYFNYNIPAYSQFLQTKYQYKLEGFYNKWSGWSNDAHMSFENLPPGKYTFLVRAKNGNKLSENVAQFNFKIAKPWYLSVWIIVLYVFLILLFLALINRLYRKSYKKKERRILRAKQRELLLMQLANEQKLIKLRNEKLRSEIEAKNRELATSTMGVVKKNELLNKIKNELQHEKQSQNVRNVLETIENNLSDSSDWEVFQEAFNTVDHNFLQNIKTDYPALTPTDLKLCTYLRLNLSSKEIAPLLNISSRSVEIKRYRLRKKLNLPHQQNLTDFILNY